MYTDFPILALRGHDENTRWMEKHFCPDGLKCPNRGAGKAHESLDHIPMPVGQTYNLHAGTLDSTVRSRQLLSNLFRCVSWW